MPVKVVIYARVSSQGARQSTSRQVNDLTDLSKKRGYEILEVFKEHISGKKKLQERKELQACINFCQRNPVDMLMVTEISRLGRTTLEILKVLDMLHQHKVNVYIQNLNIETLMPDGSVNPITSIITTLLSELAAVEWKGIIDRLQSGRRQYIEQGGKLGRKKGSTKQLDSLKEENKEVIKYLKRGYSIRAIAKIVNKSPSTVQKVKKIVMSNDNYLQKDTHHPMP